jgi:alpha-L-fucosidase 2
MRFCAMARVLAVGGAVTEADGALDVAGADEAVILLVARTSFNGFEHHPHVNGIDEYALARADMRALRGKAYPALWAAHLRDYQALYRRVTLSLDDDRYDREPTARRLAAFENRGDDRGLIELMFHYGRYLTIAASRAGSEPMNLQGIWNAELRAPWSGNYTININTQMNYWPTEAAALPELAQPLHRLIDELRRTGARTARLHYGAGGAVAHHNSDLWRLSNPVGEGREGSSVYACWPMGFGWLCAHLYEHYRYTRDAAFLREKALPALRDAARFYLDILANDGDGTLSVIPATSPDNSFILNGVHCPVARAAPRSGAIVREVFENYLSALSSLGADEPMAAEARSALGRLRPYQIGSKGQLLEWDREYEEAEPHHRHVSHMYPLHPSRQIAPDTTPALADACKKTLELRGDDGTGWSLGWKINMWARLWDGDRALKLLKMQLRYVDADAGLNYRGGGGTYANLFDAHPPFQIDGNFGACAGVIELLLQSRDDEIFLLPALPAEWKRGAATGLRAHGALEVDIAFEDGALTSATLRRVGPARGTVTVHCREKSWNLTLGPGECARIEG